MVGLKDIESSLPPGFRFYPSDEELVCHYLYNKVANQKLSEGTTMVDVDLHSQEPWELPEVAKLTENEWYFFSFRDRKYSTGSRSNRATKSGYWKATGKDKTVFDASSHLVVGMRKTLVFYSGRAPNGIKTGWVMHEFRLESPHSPPKEDWVLCRVFQKRKQSINGMMENSINGGVIDVNHNPLMQENNTSTTTSSSSFLNLAMLQCNFLDFSEEMIMNSDDHHHFDLNPLGCWP